MIHMTLVSNITNALGGYPILHPPVYPGPLPGDIGPGGVPLVVHILPFSREAMGQGMAIETPEDPIEFPIARALTAGEDEAVTTSELDVFASYERTRVLAYEEGSGICARIFKLGEKRAELRRIQGIPGAPRHESE